MDHEALLQVRGLGGGHGDTTLFASIDMDVRRGAVQFITGPSGCGKSTLLKSLALLEPIKTGDVRLHGRPPQTHGVPAWRAKVCYVSQAQPTLPGTPRDLFARASHFASQRGYRNPHVWQNVVELASRMALDEPLLLQKWTEMSGGQAQRALLAVGMGLGPEVLLLDEVTSSLDEHSTSLIEKVIKESDCGVVWVSHSREQVRRVGSSSGPVLELEKMKMRGGHVQIRVSENAAA